MALSEEELARANFELDLRAAAEEAFDCDSDIAKAMLALIAAHQSRVPADSLKGRHLAKMARELASSNDRDRVAEVLVRMQTGDADPDPVPEGYIRPPHFIVMGLQYYALQMWENFNAPFLSSRIGDLSDHFVEQSQEASSGTAGKEHEIAARMAAAMREASGASDNNRPMSRRAPDVETSTYISAYDELAVPTVAGCMPVPRAELAEHVASERGFSLAVCHTRAQPSVASPASGRMIDPSSCSLVQLTSKSSPNVSIVDGLEKTPSSPLYALVAMLDANEAAARRSTGASFLKSGQKLSGGAHYHRIRKALVEMQTPFSKATYEEALVRAEGRRDYRLTPPHSYTSYTPMGVRGSAPSTM